MARTAHPDSRMEPTRIVLARHGRTAYNTAQRFRGRDDPPLDAEGTREVELLARAMAALRPAALYASPRRRAQDTAAAIARATRAGVVVEAALDDLDYGHWTGLTHDEVRTAQPDDWATWMTDPRRVTFPGGESLEAALSRLWIALSTVATRHPAELVVVVTRDAAVRLLVCRLLGAPLEAFHRVQIHTASTSGVELYGDRWELAWLNATGHLSPGP